MFAPHRGGYSKIGRLSGPGQAQIIQLERTRLSPGVIGQALARWSSIARSPRRRLPPLFADRCGQPACCPEPADERAILEAAICALPLKTARELRLIVQRLDELIIQRQGIETHVRRMNRWWEDAF